MIPGTLKNSDSLAVAHSKEIISTNSLRLCHKTLGLLYNSLWQRHLLIVRGGGVYGFVAGFWWNSLPFDAKKEMQKYSSHESVASFQQSRVLNPQKRPRQSLSYLLFDVVLCNQRGTASGFLTACRSLYGERYGSQVQPVILSFSPALSTAT